MNFKNFQLLAFRLLYLTYDDIINCAEHIIDKWTLINDFHHLPGTLLDLHDWVNRKLRQVSGVKLRLQPATLLNVTLFHGCFSRFLNYTEVPNYAKRLTLLRTSEWRQLTSFWCLCWALWAYLAHKSFFFSNLTQKSSNLNSIWMRAIVVQKNVRIFVGFTKMFIDIIT